MKVLIVDDNREILEILALIVESDGHDVKAINNGDDFFQSVEHFRPDLILLDIMLGRHDGRRLCATLKANEQTRHLPIVMISASHAPHTFKEVACEADGFIAKPFDIDHVSNIVNTFVKTL